MHTLIQTILILFRGAMLARDVLRLLDDLL